MGIYQFHRFCFGTFTFSFGGDVFGDLGKGITMTIPAPVGESAVFCSEGSVAGEAWVAELVAQGLLEPSDP